jgi:hypothetical protein
MRRVSHATGARRPVRIHSRGEMLTPMDPSRAGAVIDSLSTTGSVSVSAQN